MRFFKVTPRIVIGENSSVSDISGFLAPFLDILVRQDAGGCLLPGLLPGGCLGLGSRLCSVPGSILGSILGRFRLGLGSILGRRVAAADGSPGIGGFFFLDVTKRSLIGALGLFLGLDLRTCLV